MKSDNVLSRAKVALHMVRGKFYPFDENLCWNTHMHKFLSVSVGIYSLKEFIASVISLDIFRIN